MLSDLFLVKYLYYIQLKSWIWAPSLLVCVLFALILHSFKSIAYKQNIATLAPSHLFIDNKTKVMLMMVCLLRTAHGLSSSFQRACPPVYYKHVCLNREAAGWRRWWWKSNYYLCTRKTPDSSYKRVDRRINKRHKISFCSLPVLGADKSFLFPTVKDRPKSGKQFAVSRQNS